MRKMHGLNERRLIYVVAVLIAWVYKAGNFDMMFETSLIWGIAPTTLHLIIAILRHYFDLPY